MNHSVVRFPVTCPVCSRESLANSSLNKLVRSLATDRPIKLYATCGHHKIAWVANEVERKQIQDYTDIVLFSLSEKSRQILIYHEQ
jgi:hypothetical protein